MPARGLRLDLRRDLGHRPGRHRDRRSLRRLDLRDDARVRRREPAREDRHARLRRSRRRQQGRAARRRRRASATCASRCAARARRSTPPRRRSASTAPSRAATAIPASTRCSRTSSAQRRREDRARDADPPAVGARVRALAAGGDGHPERPHVLPRRDRARRCGTTRPGRPSRRAARATSPTSRARARCSRGTARPRRRSRPSTPRSRARGGASIRRRARRCSTRGPRGRPRTSPTPLSFEVRAKGLEVPTFVTSLAGTRIPRVALPSTDEPGEVLRFLLLENLPGTFPYAAGVFPFKRADEEPKRQFAGEGPPDRTNRRFHLLCRGDAEQAPLDGLRLGHALRRGPGRAARHLGEGGRERRVGLLPRRHEAPLRGLRPVRPEHVGLDDDQRPGADPARDVHEHDDRPAGRPLPGRERAHPRSPRARRARRAHGPDRARHGAGRHPEGGSGAEHLHLLDGVRASHDGRHPAVVHRPRRAQLLQRLDLGLSHRRGGREPDQSARLHARQRLHVRRVLHLARDEDRRVRAESLVLLQQRPRPRVHGDRPRRAPHLGRRDARALRRQRAQPEAQVPHPDVGPLPPRAGGPVQRRAHDAAGAPRAPGPLQLAPHQRVRRGDHDADGGERAPRDGDPDDQHAASSAGSRARIPCRGAGSSIA